MNFEGRTRLGIWGSGDQPRPGEMADADFGYVRILANGNPIPLGVAERLSEYVDCVEINNMSDKALQQTDSFQSHRITALRLEVVSESTAHSQLSIYFSGQKNVGTKQQQSAAGKSS